MNDREGPKEIAWYSRNWLILFIFLILAGLAAVFLPFVIGADAASVVTGILVAILALFALIDGGWRLLGNEGFLGPGTRYDRLVAIIQVILALIVLSRFVG